jgi:hypothetical protein
LFIAVNGLHEKAKMPSLERPSLPCVRCASDASSHPIKGLALSLRMGVLTLAICAMHMSEPDEIELSRPFPSTTARQAFVDVTMHCYLTLEIVFGETR